MKQHNYFKILVVKKGWATEIQKKINNDVVTITTGNKLSDEFVDCLKALTPILLEALDLSIDTNKAYCNGVVFKVAGKKVQVMELKGYYYHSKTLERIEVGTPALAFHKEGTEGIKSKAGAFDIDVTDKIIKCWSFYTQQLVENLIDETELLISNKVSQLSLLSNEDFYDKKVEELENSNSNVLDDYYHDKGVFDKDYQNRANANFEKNIKKIINEKTGIKSITFSSKNDSVTIGEHIN